MPECVQRTLSSTRAAMGSTAKTDTRRPWTMAPYFGPYFAWHSFRRTAKAPPPPPPPEVPPGPGSTSSALPLSRKTLLGVAKTSAEGAHHHRRPVHPQQLVLLGGQLAKLLHQHAEVLRKDGPLRFGGEEARQAEGGLLLEEVPNEVHEDGRHGADGEDALEGVAAAVFTSATSCSQGGGGDHLLHEPCLDAAALGAAEAISTLVRLGEHRRQLAAVHRLLPWSLGGRVVAKEKEEPPGEAAGDGRLHGDQPQEEAVKVDVGVAGRAEGGEEASYPTGTGCDPGRVRRVAVLEQIGAEGLEAHVEGRPAVLHVVGVHLQHLGTAKASSFQKAVLLRRRVLLLEVVEGHVEAVLADDDARVAADFRSSWRARRQQQQRSLWLQAEQHRQHPQLRAPDAVHLGGGGVDVAQREPVDAVRVLAAAEGTARALLQQDEDADAERRSACSSVVGIVLIWVMAISTHSTTTAPVHRQLHAQQVQVPQRVGGRHRLRLLGVRFRIGPADQRGDALGAGVRPADALAQGDKGQPGGAALHHLADRQVAVLRAEDEVDDAVEDRLVHLGAALRVEARQGRGRWGLLQLG
ncbi:hypothetical protein TYRP_018664 [Tyrophagus putrescentiae]|nr:hypothetical protein TYRP_018664 [Tyrophagus putrescentiae]